MSFQAVKPSQAFHAIRHDCASFTLLMYRDFLLLYKTNCAAMSRLVPASKNLARSKLYRFQSEGGKWQ